MTAEEVALTCVVIILSPAFGGWVKVIESGFTNGCDFGVIEVRFDEFLEVVGRIVDIAGVNADSGGNLRVLMGDEEIDHEIIRIRRESDHAIDASFLRAGDEFRNFLGRKFVRAKVAMRVGHG